NAPADMRANERLTEVLSRPPAASPDAPAIWLGAPNAIKGPTEVVFQRRSGSNLLIVGQREETVAAMIGLGLFTLGAQYPAGQARFVLFESSAPGTRERALFDAIIQAMRH